MFRFVGKPRIAFLCLAAAVVLALPASAGDVAITSSYLKIDGLKFFRGKATNVQLGSYGEKKTPLAGVNYLAVEKNIKPSALKQVPIGVSGPYTIDWSKVSKSDVSVDARYLETANGTGSLTVEKAKSAQLVLVKFFINEGDLKNLLNNHAPEARMAMKGEKRDARIVSEVYVAMKATLASDVTTAGRVTATGNDGAGLEVTASGGSSGSTSTKISLPPNTTFAYLLHKVKNPPRVGWNGDKIANMEDDRAGIN